ncbi:hypothetical protein [Umezawaea sp.]|uniref:hypothetical protein n=1 Tax=Umezawaea sp. TaxID=1955258 RepID=UPI002ED446CA
MDAAIAAIIASSITGVVALGSAAASPWFTARHSRKAKQLELKQEVYAEALEALIAVAAISHVDDLRRVNLQVTKALIRIRLFGSDEAGDSFLIISKEIDFLLSRAQSARRAAQAYLARTRPNLEAEMAKFRDIARLDLETDGVGRPRRSRIRRRLVAGRRKGS